MKNPITLQSEELEAQCVRCGTCCYKHYAGIKIKCPYLLKLDNGETKCEIYGKNVGAYVGTIRGVRFHCNLRENIKFNYEGCPHNKERLEYVK